MIGDIRYALRTFARRPSFVIAAVLTLALGISVNTVVFSLINSLLLRPIPVPDAHRVVRMAPIDGQGRHGNQFSYPDYLDYRDAQLPLETIAAYIPVELTAGRASLDTGETELRRVLGYVVSASYFDITGVGAAAGRVLRADDERADGRVVVLSHAFWQGRFGGSPDTVGASLMLNGTRFSIVGIATPGFAGTEPLVADCWIPVSQLAAVQSDTRDPGRRDVGSLFVIGKLNRGVTPDVVSRAMSMTAQRLAMAYPGNARPAAIEVAAKTFMPMDPGLKPLIGVLMVIVGLVLLIACANATNLALARAASRQREIALRLAIGAGRARIVRQLLVEAVLVGLAAGASGLLAAVWLLRLLFRVGVSLAALPWAFQLSLEPDARVFSYTAAIALGGGVLLGLLPALQSSSPRLVEALHGGGVPGARLRGAALRRTLVTGQVAASLVLLLAAGLLLRALRSAETLDLGFHTAGVVYADYDPRAARLSPARAAALNAGLLETARSIPGVTHVALTSHVPLNGGIRATSVRLIGSTGALADAHAFVSTVSPDYFATLQIPFTAGRGFDASARGEGPIAIVSEGLARRFWPGRPAVGQGVALDDGVTRTVVGVVRDAADAAIWREKQLAVYVPIEAGTDPRDLRLLMRTTGDVALAGRMLAGRSAAIAGEMRFTPTSLDALLRLWNLPSKMAAAGAGVLAALALTLACVGLYGVLTFAVAERMREIGIRMAIGAESRSIVGLILRDAGRMVAGGVAAGALCGLPAAPLLGRMLFGVSAFDPLTLATVVVALTIIALATAYVPARRASRLEPLAVLRTE